MNTMQAVITGLFGGGFFAFLQFLIKRHDEKKDSPIKMALLALCSERLESLLYKWINGDEHAVARWVAIQKLHKAYLSLGGNSEIQALYDIAKEIKPTAD